MEKHLDELGTTATGGLQHKAALMERVRVQRQTLEIGAFGVQADAKSYRQKGERDVSFAAVLENDEDNVVLLRPFLTTLGSQHFQTKGIAIQPQVPCLCACCDNFVVKHYINWQ